MKPLRFLCLQAIALAAFAGLGSGSAPAFAQRTLQVSPPGAKTSFPLVSSDGRTVVFHGPGGFTLVRPDGSWLRATGVDGGPYGASLSGDGRLLAYQGWDFLGDSFIYVLDTQTLNKVDVSAALWGLSILPDISADGSTVVFVDAAQNWRLYAVDSNGSNLRPIGGALEATEGGPSITADGSIVASDGGDDSFPGCDIFRVDADGTGSTCLSLYDSSRFHIRARISDDGGKVTKEQWYGGPLFAVEGDGSRVTQLGDLWTGFNGEGHDYSAISGDGRTAVFSTGANVFVVRTDGTGLRQIGRGYDVAIDGRGDVVAWSDNISGIQVVMATGAPGVAPGEMDSLMFGPDAATLTWASSPAANSHNLYRGDLGSLGAVNVGSCLRGAIAESTAADPEAPAPGLGFAYLVTGENGAGEGTLGSTSGGVERGAGLSCPLSDSDGDGSPDAQDNCPLIVNPQQEDTDGDGLGDRCDNCVIAVNYDQRDMDHDGIGDHCECLVVYNPGSSDGDGDGMADTCDSCPSTYNPAQEYLVDPVVGVIKPNGGGSPLKIGEVTAITWVASDVCGGVSLVDIYLSRTGIEGPYERVAVGLSNLGSFDWLVTGPRTSGATGFVRIVARDPAGNSGQDESDRGFHIQ